VIAADFIWDPGDPEVGLRAGWEDAVVQIEDKSARISVHFNVEEGGGGKLAVQKCEVNYVSLDIRSDDGKWQRFLDEEGPFQVAVKGGRARPAVLADYDGCALAAVKKWNEMMEAERHADEELAKAEAAQERYDRALAEDGKPYAT
jgi:hypothetical protein